MDASDNVQKSYTYDAYGNTTASSSSFLHSFAYIGAVIDTESGLYYLNARYYDPQTGRFISQDSYRGDSEAFWHLYAYCEGDPVNFADLTGYEPAFQIIAAHEFGHIVGIADGYGSSTTKNIDSIMCNTWGAGRAKYKDIQKALLAYKYNKTQHWSVSDL